MKKLLGFVMLVLVMGLAVSPALASAEGVPEQTPAVQQIPTCPCCSGNVTLPTDIQVQKLNGPMSYLMALKAFNTRNSIKLRMYLQDQKLIPVYGKAIVLLVKHNGTTTEVVKVPLIGPTSMGQLVYVKNTNGEGVAIGTGEKGTISSVYIVKDGAVKEINPIQLQGFFGWAKCHTCEVAVTGLCTLGTGTIARLGCAAACAFIAALFIEDPVVAAAWGAVCVPACSLGVRVYGCEYGAYKICKAIGMCG